MLNFVIGFFVGALTLYIAICVYYYIKLNKLYKDRLPNIGANIDYDEVINHINEMEPINKK